MNHGHYMGSYTTTQPLQRKHFGYKWNMDTISLFDVQDRSLGHRNALWGKARKFRCNFFFKKSWNDHHMNLIQVLYTIIKGYDPYFTLWTNILFKTKKTRVLSHTNYLYKSWALHGVLYHYIDPTNETFWIQVEHGQHFIF